MILKSSRIPVGRTRQIARYLAAEAENDVIHWRRGGVADIEMMGQVAKALDRSFGVRHIVIAPEIPLVGQDLTDVLRAVQSEYEVSDLALNQSCIMEHVKPRLVQGRGVPHFHLALPELDLQTGRVMDSRFTRLRDEKLARLLELQLGHPLTLGRFNKEVFVTLAETFPELDLAPYQKALRHRAEQFGWPPDHWHRVRIRAPWRREMNALETHESVFFSTAKGVQISL